LHAVATTVRDRITGHIAEQTGLVVTEVDVTVVDVQTPGCLRGVDGRRRPDGVTPWWSGTSRR
jgi:hypothetical protein